MRAAPKVRFTRRSLWAFLFLLASQAHVARAVTASLNDLVRVKFLTLAFPLSIEGNGVTIRGVSTPNIKSAAIPKSSRIEIDFKAIAHQKIWFVKENQNLNRLSQKYLEITSLADKIRISGFEVATPILVSPKGEIISALPLDTYLQGVLAGEMPSNWPVEALKAQVVAARTYTLYEIHSRNANLFHVQAGILDQAYTTVISDTQKQRIKAAIDATHGLVMTRNGEAIKAYYHADCGGQTEDPDYVWGQSTKKLGLQSVSDVQCALNPQSKWQITIPLEDLIEKLDSRHLAIKEIASVRVASKTPSGRVALLAFNDGDGKEVFISGNELRSLVGFMKLKSTTFQITKNEDSVVFSGRGFGHGSGLCQQGAKFLAEKGATVKDILKHYYPRVSFQEFHVADR